MRIAVDVMGGDHGCAVVVEGARMALERDPGISGLFLVGQDAQIRACLQQIAWRDSRVEIVHAAEVLTMDDKPVVGLRKKKECSIARAMELVKEGRAEALISPGNTGGVVAAATLKLRPVPGIDRPAIATVIPAPENEFVLIDSGANVDCKPFHLLQFAVMGHAYSRKILGVAKPRVGLLNVGTEDVKGNDLTHEAFRLCKQTDLNFIGNVEGHDLFANRVDVVVCDGFVGNVVLKTCESLAAGIFGWLKRELMQNCKRKVGAYLAKNAFAAIKKRMDPDAYGGAPLLGVNGSVMIAHGSAKQRAIANAVRLAAQAAQHKVTQDISREAQRAQLKLKSPSEPAASFLAPT